jgi:hypothetical protein
MRTDGKMLPDQTTVRISLALAQAPSKKNKPKLKTNPGKNEKKINSRTKTHVSYLEQEEPPHHLRFSLTSPRIPQSNEKQTRIFTSSSH